MVPLPRDLIAALVLLALACEREPTRRPDIVLVSLDSVRADALTFTDPDATPRLAQLATQGTVFSQAISGTSWTLPAHVQMMTGSPPALHGVESDDVIVDPLMPVLPELLRRYGYTTAGLYTGGYLRAEFGFERGFAVYRSVAPPGALEMPASDVEARGAAVVSSALVVEQVRELLGELDRDLPLFLFLHLYDPHYDYVPPAPWDARFDSDYEGSIEGRRFMHNLQIWDESKQPSRQIGARDLEHIIALYRGEIGWTDGKIGEILDLLRGAGRLDNALIAVTADHGEEFFEHAGRGHRHTLFDELLRVPLLIVPPGGSRARSVAAQVSLSDLAPTLLDYAGVPIPDSMYGSSLRPALEGSPIESKPLVSSVYHTSVNKSGQPYHRIIQSLRTPDWKLLRTIVVTTKGRVRYPEVAWYDLRADPRERDPIADPAEPRLVNAWQRLEAETEALREHWARQDHTADVDRMTDTRVEMEDLLRALGYVERGFDVSTHPVLDLPWGLAPMPAVDLADVKRRSRGED